MPAPKPGESKESFISRYMASAEAQKDFPDEKQRAAVAYSTFGERKNDMPMPLCSDCGSEMYGDAARLECRYCGLVDRNPTPPVENIPNICRNPQCLHSMSAEHDALGCHIAGCLCTETRQAIETPKDVLPNENASDPAVYDELKKVKAEIAKLEASGAETERLAKLKTTKAGLEQQAKGGEAKNADGACAICGHPSSNHGTGDPICNANPGGKTCSCAGYVSGPEKKNAEPSEAQWKDKSDYQPDGGCKKCKWGAPGTGHSSGYHKNDCAVLKKERDLYTHFQGAERRNAMDRFDAHAKACEGCMNAYNSGAPESMCEAGRGMLNADKVAQGGDEYKSAPGGSVKVIPESKPFNNAVGKEQAVGILKWVAGESLKPVSVNLDSGETVTIEQLEQIAGTGRRPEHRNAGDINDLGPEMARMWDGASLPERKRTLDAAGIADSAAGLVQLRWSQVPQHERAQIASNVFGVENKNSVDPNDTKCDACNAYGVITRPTSACGDAVKNFCRACWEKVKEIGPWPAEDVEVPVAVAAAAPASVAGGKVTILVNSLAQGDNVSMDDAAAAGAAFFGGIQR